MIVGCGRFRHFGQLKAEVLGHRRKKGAKMTNSANPVEELRRHGLIDDSVSSADAEWILSSVSNDQLTAFVDTSRRIEALQDPSVQEQPVDDGSLALAMTKAMGWDRPTATAGDAEVEGMAAGSCLCACTGGGGGGGGGSLD
jgi:hypothetical protein